MDHDLVAGLPAGDALADLPDDPRGVGAADVVAVLGVVAVVEDRDRLAERRPDVVEVDAGGHHPDDRPRRRPARAPRSARAGRRPWARPRAPGGSPRRPSSPAACRAPRRASILPLRLRPTAITPVRSGSERGGCYAIRIPVDGGPQAHRRRPAGRGRGARRSPGSVGAARRRSSSRSTTSACPTRPGEIVADALREPRRARGRGAAALQRRLATGPPRSTRRPRPGPRSSPSCRSTPGRCPGIPDLMHHKYVVRDREAVWTGLGQLDDRLVDPAGERARSRSTSEPLGARLRGQLRRALGAPRRRAQRPRRAATRRARRRGRGRAPGSRPATARSCSQAIAAAIGAARAAGPDRLAGDHLGADPRHPGRARPARHARHRRGRSTSRRPTPSSASGPTNGARAWKIPLLARTLQLLAFSGKPSTPWRPGDASTTSCTPR